MIAAIHQRNDLGQEFQRLPLVVAFVMVRIHLDVILITEVQRALGHVKDQGAIVPNSQGRLDPVLFAHRLDGGRKLGFQVLGNVCHDDSPIRGKRKGQRPAPHRSEHQKRSIQGLAYQYLSKP